MIRSKKGVGRTLITGIGFFLATILFLTMQRHAIPENGYPGNTAYLVMENKYDTEKVRLFVDYSAKYALQYALRMNAEQGGLPEAPCGTYLLP